jgi:hypothetical protein
MGAPQNSYWSIEACGWVRSSAPEVDVPVQRPAEELEVEEAAAEALEVPADLPSRSPA